MYIEGRLPGIDIKQAFVDVRIHVQHGAIRVDFPDRPECWVHVVFTIEELESLLSKSRALLLTDNSESL